MAAQAPLMKKKVAAIVTVYTDDRRLKSHASVIVGRLLEGYAPNGRRVEPRTQVVSMYTHQVPENDLSRERAARHGFTIYPTIKDAMTLAGGDLAVDAVCFVGEHGDYPVNERGQKLYPRYELMEPVAEVFRRTGRSVPVFFDKHLSYSWLKAKEIYRWSRELNFPLMAGSSIPLTVRTPQVEIPYGAKLEGAVAVGYGGLDAYGFHTLESLQCMVERRAGGETGLRAVQWIEGPDVWRWRDSGQGRWSRPLLDAALSRLPEVTPGRMEDNVKEPVVFVLEYADGLRAAAYMLNGHASGWSFGAGVPEAGGIVSTCFGFPSRATARPLAHFDGLVDCMEQMFVTGKPVYPVERTLLTTCALSMLFESRAWRRRIESPELRIRYQAPGKAYFQTS
jgi:hypothetical protein